jgi:hypothetical protein
LRSAFVDRASIEGIDMTEDANKEGEWVTGIIGEPFQLDKDGNPIPNAPSEPPTDLPTGTDIWDAVDKAPGGGLGDLMPTGIVPGGSQEIGGNDDETQKEIWNELDRGDFGSDGGAGTTPEDAETTI